MTTKHYVCVNFFGEKEWLRATGKPTTDFAEATARVQMMNRNYATPHRRYAVCVKEGKEYKPTMAQVTADE